MIQHSRNRAALSVTARNPRLAVVLAAAAAAAVIVHVRRVRPWQLTWGATPRDALGRGTRDLRDEGAALVADADRPVGRLHGQGPAGVDHADVDALSGHDQGAAAGHAPLDPDRLGRRDRWRPGRAGIADAGCLGRGERVGQAAP
jgi:hypothetical protein